MDYRPKRLTRSSRERLWAGVAGGMAEYFDVDPAIMRIIWVAAAVLTSGLAVPAYIVLWLVMPKDDAAAPVATPPPSPSTAASGVTAGAGPFGAADAAPFGSAGAGPFESTAPGPTPTSFTPEEEELLRPVTPPPPPPRSDAVPDPEESSRRRRAAGILLIGIGLLFFAHQLGIFVRLRWDLIAPLALVGFGVFILMKQGNGFRR